MDLQRIFTRIHACHLPSHDWNCSLCHANRTHHCSQSRLAYLQYLYTHRHHNRTTCRHFHLSSSHAVHGVENLNSHRRIHLCALERTDRYVLLVLEGIHFIRWVWPNPWSGDNLSLHVHIRNNSGISSLAIRRIHDAIPCNPLRSSPKLAAGRLRHYFLLSRRARNRITLNNDLDILRSNILPQLPLLDPPDKHKRKERRISSVEASPRLMIILLSWFDN